MSRALTSDRLGYFLNVLLSTDCNPLSSLKQVANDVNELKKDFEEDLEDFQEEAHEKRQVVEEQMQANLTAISEKYDKAGHSMKTKIVNMLWNLGYIIGSIALCALLIGLGFGIFSVWRNIKLGKQILTNVNIIDLLKTKIFN